MLMFQLHTFVSIARILCLVEFIFLGSWTPLVRVVDCKSIGLMNQDRSDSDEILTLHYWALCLSESY
jgi:hypothetical protein